MFAERLAQADACPQFGFGSLTRLLRVINDFGQTVDRLQERHWNGDLSDEERRAAISASWTVAMVAAALEGEAAKLEALGETNHGH